MLYPLSYERKKQLHEKPQKMHISLPYGNMLFGTIFESIVDLLYFGTVIVII
jgi:hypothetical protein